MMLSSGNFQILAGEASNLKGYLQAINTEISCLLDDSKIVKAEDVVSVVKGILDSLLEELPMLQCDARDILVLRIVRSVENK